MVRESKGEAGREREGSWALGPGEGEEGEGGSLSNSRHRNGPSTAVGPETPSRWVTGCPHFRA